MKRPTILAACLLAGVAALAVAFGMYNKQPKGSRAKEQESSTPRGIENRKEYPKLSDAPPYVSSQGVSNYAKVFSESHSYLDFARSIIDDAKAGNPDAEYYLGRALRLCNQSRALFRFNSQEIGLEDALIHYSSGQNSQKKIKAVYERCHDLEAVADQAKQFGNADDWIKAASNQGQPVAQSDEALRKFSAIQKSAMTGVGDFNELTKSGEDPRSLFLAAVQTKDPEVLFNIGQAQAYLSNFDGESTKNQLAWWLVACNRGLPCDSNSEFQLNVATNDGLLEALSGRDLICTMAGKDCQAVEQRAQEINENLNAEKWSLLGL